MSEGGAPPPHRFGTGEPFSVGLEEELPEGDVYNITVADNHNYVVFTQRYTPVLVNNCHAAITAVAEAGVIGKPDPVAGEVVKAFVALKTGFTASDELRLELLGFARKRLGPAVAPREIDFLPSIPRNRAGKIMRRVLKARELGLPEGDVSTMEVPA